MSPHVRSAARHLPVVLAVAVLMTVCLLAPAQAGQRYYDFQKKTLDNGLTVITLEDHSCPVVAVQVWYHVGSKNEDAERQGFAHMFEHMMFRGTDHVTGREYEEAIHRAGGWNNAYTAFDNTTYISVVPAHQLDLALWLEADRMAMLKIDDEIFYTERNVVEEERRQGTNAPYGRVPEKLLPAIFKKHPYRWTPIGSIPHLRETSIDELQKFWDKYYVPSNATLVIVGDVTHTKAQALAEKYFGWIPKMPKPAELAIKEPPQTEPREITISEKKGPIPLVGLLYRGVSQHDPDALALDMLMSILGGGESSRLYQDLVKERKMAEVAMAGSFTMEDDGLLGAGAALLPMKGDPQAVLAAMREHIERIKKEGVTERELTKVKNQALRGAVTGALSVSDKATLLGSYETLEDDAEKANQQFAEIRAVTREDVQRVANKYLVKERETVAQVKPSAGGMLKSMFGMGKEDDVDEGAEPATPPAENRVAQRGAPRDASLTPPTGYPMHPPLGQLDDSYPDLPTETYTLDNGLQVVVVPNHEVPFVTLTLGVLNGAWTEAKPGTASMAAGLITKGTESHTAAELAEELEFHAISLAGSAGMDVASVNASCVTDQFDHATQLMAEVVRTPTFPKEEFDIARNQTVMGLMMQAQQAEYQADRELRQRLYGKHPYARTATGEPDDLQALTVDDLKGWWGRFVRPENSVLYVAGDIQPGRALGTARKYFSDWQAATPVQKVELASIPVPAPTRIYLVDRPGSVQSQIRIGHVSVTRQSPDYFQGRLLSEIFGGSFISRLVTAIRHERGLTYGAGGGLSASRFAGQFTMSTFTKTPKTAEAIDVILQEIDKLRSSPVTDEELQIAQSHIIGSFAGDRETPQAVVRDLWLIKYAGLTADYLKRYLAGIKSATADDLLATAQRIIQRDKLTIVVVGNAAELKDALEKIAPVTVVPASGTKDEAQTGEPVALTPAA